MRAFALTCDALARLDSTEAKVRCAASYLLGRPQGELPVAARFLSGSPLPPGEPPPGVGSATIVRLVAERLGIDPRAVRREATRAGDLGEAVAALIPAGQPPRDPPLRLTEVASELAHFGELLPRQREGRLGDLYERAGRAEAKYLTKLLLGSMRIGMQAARVEEALAVAYRRPVEKVRRAHMLLGDIGRAAVATAEDRLDEVELRAGRPVRSMLAHPVGTVEEVLEQLDPPFLGEHKYDGIRAQVHRSERGLRIYTRSLEDCTHLFPELQDALPDLDGEWILDGEVLAWDDGRPLSFERLQRRLGRTQVPLTLLLDVPVVFFAFDVLRSRGRDLLDEPLSARRGVVEQLPAAGAVRPAAAHRVGDLDGVRRTFDDALEAGHEGALFKSLEAPYTPGSRGRAWVKLKQPIGTLDVVVTAAEYGSGKRAGWLSDLTFAVRGPDGLLEVGKAYSGLTDDEIQELTDHFEKTTLERRGAVRQVEPTVFLEVAFSGIQQSERHPSGFALRFPRIVRWRRDISLRDIDTLERVVRLHER